MRALLKISSIFVLLLCIVAALQLRSVHGAVRTVRISDQLDDVVDNEEDEEWKAWGKPKPKPKSAYNPPPDFVDGMDVEKYQRELMKRSMSTSMGFVKLRLGVSREPEEPARIAKKWTDLLKTGTIDVKIVAVDRNTLMVTIPEGENLLEVKDFILSQPDAYEFKLGDNVFRRPGDPPLDVVVERLKKERETQGKQSAQDVKEDL
ncbi:unnamed protein product [Calypogeia fissa]